MRNPLGRRGLKGGLALQWKVLSATFLMVVGTVGFGQVTALGVSPGVTQTFGAANTATSTTLTASTGTGTGAADLLVGVIGVRNTLGLATVSGVTDSASNTWTKAVGVTQGTQSDGEVWFSANAASVSSVTVTLTSASALAFSVLDVTGALASPLDQIAMNSNTTTTPTTGTTGTTSQGSEIAIAGIGWNGSNTISGQTAGYTNLAIQKSTASGAIVNDQAAYKILTATGVQSYGATLTGGAWTGAIATFKFGASTPAPTITSVTPGSGHDGDAVTITGTNFTAVSSVTFNGTPDTTFSVTDVNDISAHVPTGATSGFIKVTTAGGTATSPSSFSVLPAITTFTPGDGPIGTQVTITGTGFTGATSVTFNGAIQNQLTVTGDTQITAKVPCGAGTGTNPITVTTPAGSTNSSTSFTVDATPTPNITNLNPTSGSVGAQVVITGSGFGCATAVGFTGASQTALTVNSPTQITTTVPSGATTGTVTVTTPGGTSAPSAQTFTVTTGPPVPTITSFNPIRGSVGTAVVITGTGFTGATAVTFNGKAASVNVTDDSHISTSVPTGATTGVIKVTTPGGTATSSTSFIVLPHILVVMMENREYSSVIGSSSAPYLNSLATTYRSATNWYAVQHNSPHDYLDITAGWDLNLPAGQPYSATTLVDQLHTNGNIPWKAYMESMPSPNCNTGGTTANGLYDPIHNQFHYFTNYNSTQSTGWCTPANLGTEGVLPYPGASSLVSTLNGANAPDFVWITPNNCDNMHGDTNSGSPCLTSTKSQLTKAGDTWLSNNIGPVISSTWFSQNGIIIITWDEGSTNLGCCGLTAPGGHIATVVVAYNNKGLGKFTSTGDLYGILAGIQNAYGVPHLVHSGDSASGDLSGAF